MDNPTPAKRRPFTRNDHRARSHESAHAEAELAAELQPPVDHPLVPRGEANIIETSDGLARLIERLRSAGRFAYDSEFIGELTYFPKLCLIQAASQDEVALIDPLADLSLEPFWELLADGSVEKIVHAGQQDIEPVIRHLGRPAANVFDTQISAGFAGLPYPVSLSKLVLEVAEARLGKGLTFSHWDRRPLSEIQLRYAADDVRYLPLVRERLGQWLTRLGHEGWAAEECAGTCDMSRFRFDPATQYLRVRGASSLGPRNLAVLRELTIWRDTAARAHDVPPRTFLRDEVMLDLARTPVRSIEKLNRVRGLPRPVEHAHGAQIVEMTVRALALPPEALPAPREAEPTPREKFAAEALWAAAQCLCAGRSVDPSLASDRQEVGEFAALFRSNGDLSQHRLMQGWRKAALGDDLLALLQGRSSLTLKWMDGLLQAAATA
jgi:ribonuclease D